MMSDEHTERLLAHVRPPGWRNPDPAPRYDLVVVGGGTAGLVCAAGAAGLGARVALVERDRLGGDCLNTGCVPSKALIRSARAVREARAAPAVGVRATTDVDFGAVMARVRARRADIAPHDSAARFAALGVDVFLGAAAFTGARSVAVEGRTLTFRRAVIATGGRPSAPPIPGLRDGPYFTNENIFSVTEAPRALLVLGGGAVGCELAQAFALLGTRVTLVDAAPRLLPREDADASAIVARRLADDGVRVVTGSAIREISRANGKVTAHFDAGEGSGDAVLVAVGRAPNVDGLDLAAAGVQQGRDGVAVDDHLRTSNPRIYAAGDVCSPFKFTHAADAMARIVVQNALFFGRRRASALVIPWCTYTLPEVAQVGLAAAEAQARGASTITIPLTAVDRSIVDDEGEGFVRVHHLKGKVLGATIVAPHAGETIGQFGSLMRRGGSLGELSSEIFPYPTVAEALRRAGDTYRRTQLTPRVQTLLRRYFAIMRRL
jgi:pyruvate/2-oxoglutarate dehydrogenase complex dihydrolipoamide dehydrogenase (E3) component